MSIFNIFKPKKTEQTTELYSFDETDRELSIQKRRLNAEKRKLREQIEITRMKKELYDLKNELDEYTSDEDDSEDDNLEDNLLTSLLPLLLQNKGLSVNQPIPQAPMQAETKVSLTDEDIQAYIHTIPYKYLRLAKKLNDEQLSKLIVAHLPNLDDKSIQKAINALKSQ